MGKLAITGGAPLNTDPAKLSSPWPVYGEAERNALEKVLNSNIWGTLGPCVEAFCKRFTAYQGVPYGIAVNNGTISMEIALRAMGIGRGDEVIIPPYSFYATASCVCMVGATPVFADIDMETYNISPESIEKAITPKTKAIIPVHLGGLACDMDRIMEIARKNNLYVIEDAAQSNGSEWMGRKLGSIGDVGSFSFQASKNLNAGEGGFITVRDEKLYDLIWSIHNCGRDIHGGGWHHHVNVSTNARMTEWQAAILDAQMNKHEAESDMRIKIADFLSENLAQFPFINLRKIDKRITRDTYHLYLFRYQKDQLKGVPKKKFLEALRAEGIPVSDGYIPMYRQPVFESETFRRITGSTIKYSEMFLPNVEKGAQDEIVFTGMRLLMAGEEAIKIFIAAIQKIMENVDELL